MAAQELTPGRRALLELVAARVPARSEGGVRVAVDGVDGAGKTAFADQLNSGPAGGVEWVVPVVRVLAQSAKFRPRAPP